VKTTREDFDAYMRWQKYILSTHPKLPKDDKGKGYVRTTLIAYCLAMAIHGTNGRECFASDKTIGKAIGIANREVVSRYRHLALDLGWFVRSGKRQGRAEKLNVSIPSETREDPPGATDAEVPSVRQASAPVVADTEHDPMVSFIACPACDLLRGQLSDRERIEAHRKSSESQRLNVPLG
jgi:hypothetical protein